MISKEEKRDYDKVYRLKNKEKDREHAKKYYQENKEKIIKRTAEYGRKHPRDKEKRKIISKRYREKYPIKSRLACWKRRGIDITIEGYKEIYEKQNGSCAICGVY
jgi:hypothetical protein